MNGGIAHEIAPGVFWLPLGKGVLRGSNVYLVRSGGSWCLVDAGWSRDGPAIRRAAEEVTGAGEPPTAIVLTHAHPDHVGAVPELAALWRCPVLLHPAELPIALGDVEAIRRYAAPLDRWVILPALRLMGRRRMESMMARSSLRGTVTALEAGGDVPGLEGWRVVDAPGHTPGHVAFYRPADGVVITGDALLTIELNSLRGIVSREQRPAAAPWYTTWDRATARRSIAALAGLEPRVIAAGHGDPMVGNQVRLAVRRLADRLLSV